jgi:hypothetical protein
MSIRFDASTDRLVRTADLINYNLPYSIGGWFRMAASTGAYAYLFVLNNGTTDDSNEDMTYFESDGATLALFASVGGAYTFGTDATLVAGVPYHLMMVRQDPSTLILYKNALPVIQVTRSISGRTASTRQEIGGLSTSFAPVNGSIAVIKAYQAALTQPEILAEARQTYPARRQNIYGWWPTPGGANRVKDYSGFGRDWTPAGTLTDEVHPPVVWQERRPQFWWFGSPAAATEITGSAAITLESFVLSAAGTVEVAGTAAIQIGNLSLSAAGAVEVTGAAALQIGDLVLSSAGAVEVAGNATMLIGDLVLEAAGAVEIAGAGSVQIGDMTLSAAGTVEVSGAAMLQVGDLVVDAAGTVEVSGAAALQIGDMTLNAAGVVGAEGIYGELVAQLDDLVLEVAGTVDVSGAAVLQIGDLVLNAAGVVGAEGIYGELVALLDDLVLDAAGTVDVSGAAALQVGDLVLDAAGAVEIAGVLDAQLGDLVLEAAGTVVTVGGIIGSATIVLESFILVARGTPYQPVHPSRSFAVEIENRSYRVEPESRVFVVPAESRSADAEEV